MTSPGGSCIENAPPTKQTNLITLPVVLHEELVSSTDVCVEVPGSVSQVGKYVGSSKPDAAPCDGQVRGLG